MMPIDTRPAPPMADIMRLFMGSLVTGAWVDTDAEYCGAL